LKDGPKSVLFDHVYPQLLYGASLLLDVAQSGVPNVTF